MTSKSRGKPDNAGQRLSPGALAVAIADGLTVREISEVFGVPKSTVGDRLRRPDVEAAIERELSWRTRTLLRFRLRHVDAAFAFAAKVAVGEARIESPEQFEVLRYFMGWSDEGAAALTADAPPPQAVCVHLPESWRPELPVVIDG